MFRKTKITTSVVPKTKSVPLDATLIKGSHGVPVAGGGVLLSSGAGTLGSEQVPDTLVRESMLRQLGIEL